MTFAEVPMGHIFRKDCDCMLRRTGHWTYTVIEPCQRHKWRTNHAVAPDEEPVQYDALAAMLESSDLCRTLESKE